MKHKQNKIQLILLASLLNLIFTYQANAYIDPGTGSYVFQMMIAAILGASYTIKVYWQKIISFFTNLFCKTSKNPND